MGTVDRPERVESDPDGDPCAISDCPDSAHSVQQERSGTPSDGRYDRTVKGVTSGPRTTPCSDSPDAI